MEKTRVKKGEKYRHLYIGSRNTTTMEKTDYHNSTDNDYFKSGDITQEEAEVMAKRISARLNCTDVIEMPSEEEWKQISISLNGGLKVPSLGKDVLQETEN